MLYYMKYVKTVKFKMSGGMDRPVTVSVCIEGVLFLRVPCVL